MSTSVKGPFLHQMGAPTWYSSVCEQRTSLCRYYTPNPSGTGSRVLAKEGGATSTDLLGTIKIVRKDIFAL